MGRVYLFSDEAGNFDFSRKEGATRYFAIGTAMLRDSEPAALQAELLRLRTDLAWRRLGLDNAFHATEDKQVVRDEVFKVLAKHSFRVDVTLLEKSKAMPQTRSSETTFYKYALYCHLKSIVTRVCSSEDELMVVAAEIGTKKRIAFWPSFSDPCLQAADYCLWAVYRKWERGDYRSYDLVRHMIRTEFDLWSRGTTHYY